MGVASRGFAFLVTLLICVHDSESFARVRHCFFPTAEVLTTSKLEVASFAYFAAGGLAASFSHAVAVPIDVVKTKIQTEPLLYGGAGGIVGAGKKIVKDEGMQFLLQGLGPTISGYMIQGSLKYGFYEIFKPMLLESHPEVFADHKVLLLITAAALAETIGSSTLTPFEAARIRLVDNPDYATGLQSALGRMLEDGGYSGLFSSLIPILTRNVPYTMIQLALFETITSAIYAELVNEGITDAGVYKFAITAAGASVAAVFATLCSQPGDVLLTRFNQEMNSERTPESYMKSPVDTMIEGVQELGIRGLFVGTKARLLQLYAIVVTQLLVYDSIKILFGILPTGAGSH